MSIEIENRESRIENQELELTGRGFDSAELQGHAIKNQDLLAAAGAVSLKGSAGMSALAEDMEAAAQVRHAYRLAGCSSEGMTPSILTKPFLCAFARAGTFSPARAWCSVWRRWTTASRHATGS